MTLLNESANFVNAFAEIYIRLRENIAIQENLDIKERPKLCEVRKTNPNYILIFERLDAYTVNQRFVYQMTVKIVGSQEKVLYDYFYDTTFGDTWQEREKSAKVFATIELINLWLIQFKSYLEE